MEHDSSSKSRRSGTGTAKASTGPRSTPAAAEVAPHASQVTIGDVVVVVVVVVEPEVEFAVAVDVDSAAVVLASMASVAVGKGAEHWLHFVVTALPSAPWALAKASAQPGGNSPAGKHCAYGISCPPNTRARRGRGRGTWRQRWKHTNAKYKRRVRGRRLQECRLQELQTNGR